MCQWFNSTFRHNFYLERFMNIQTINFLNQLKIASCTNNELIKVDFNLLTLNIVKVLYKSGLIQSFNLEQQTFFSSRKSKIAVSIRYYYNKPVFKKLVVVSSPSKLNYLDYQSISRLNTSRDHFFFSTSKGILNSFECKQQRLGGMLLFIC